MHSTLQDLVVLYAVALVALLVGGRLRAPAIVSLILTGILAGPGGLGLVSSQEHVATLSEIGVALLLFMVGLDLPFGDMSRLWRVAARPLATALVKVVDRRVQRIGTRSKFRHPVV